MITEKGPEALLKSIQIERITDIKDVFLQIAQRIENDGISDHATIVEALMAAAFEASVATVPVLEALEGLRGALTG